LLLRSALFLGQTYLSAVVGPLFANHTIGFHSAEPSCIADHQGPVMTELDASSPNVDPALQARPLQGPASAGQLSLEYLSGANSGNVNDPDAAGSEQESAVMRSRYRGLSWDKKHRR